MKPASQNAIEATLRKHLAVKFGPKLKTLDVDADALGGHSLLGAQAFIAAAGELGIALPEGKLFSPERTAGYLLARIDSLHDGPSGRFLAWDGEEIPW